MKAFELTYNVPGEVNSVVALAESKEQLEAVLENRDPRYTIGRPACMIISSHEIPLSAVMMRDLTAFDFILLQNTIKHVNPEEPPAEGRVLHHNHRTERWERRD